jgi:NADH-quinone oxidoreductase subunit J
MDLQEILFWVIAIMTGLCAIAVVVTQNIVRSATWLLFTLAGTSGVFFLLGADFVGATQLLVYVGGTLVLVVFGVMLTAQGPFISMKTGPAEWAIATGVGLLLYGVLAVSIVTSTFAVESRKEEREAARQLREAQKLQNEHKVDRAMKGYRDLIAALPGTQAATDARRMLKNMELAAGGHPEEEDDPPARSQTSVELGEALLGFEEATPERKLTGLPANLPAGQEPNRKRVAYLLPFEIVSVHLLVVLIGAAYLARAKRRRGAVA